MVARICFGAALLGAVLSAGAARAQEVRPELTPAGRAMLKGMLSAPVRPMSGGYIRASTKPAASPRPVCMFRGGLCSAVNQDGTIAVPPRYDWVGEFFDGRAAVRVGGLYGFVDETGREIVQPKYRLVDDFKFGFAQFDVDGKSGLIDRDGNTAIAPKYGFIEATGQDRFWVSDKRFISGPRGGVVFGIGGPSPGRVVAVFYPGSSQRSEGTTSSISPLVVSPSFLGWRLEGRFIDGTGRLIEETSIAHEFDKDDPTVRWVQKNNLWGLRRADGTWLVEPKFQQADPLRGGLARVTLNGKVGFVDATGKFAIDPLFDIEVERISLRLDDGLLTFLRGGKWGLADTAGQ